MLYLSCRINDYGLSRLSRNIFLISSNGRFLIQFLPLVSPEVSAKGEGIMTQEFGRNNSVLFRLLQL